MNIELIQVSECLWAPELTFEDQLVLVAFRVLHEGLQILET